jgi:hypothetical protein
MGSVRVNTDNTVATTPCIIICHSFPSWLLVTTELRLTPHADLLDDTTYVAVIQALVPSFCQVYAGNLCEFCLPVLGKHSVCLVDGAFNTKLGNWLKVWKLTQVYYT